MNSSINLSKTLGDDIEDFHEEIVMGKSSSDHDIVAGGYSFQTKLLTAADLRTLKAKHQEFFKTFSKRDIKRGLQNQSNSKDIKYELSICNRKTYSI